MPPLTSGSAVPDNETANVPLVVTGDPVTLKNVGTVMATLVTVPVPADPELAAVIRPYASTVILDRVYEPGVTAVVTKSNTGVAPPVLEIRPLVPLTLVTVPVPGVKPNAVVTSVDDSVTAPVRVLKLVTPPAVPFAALVIRPFESTVILALVYDPGVTAVVFRSRVMDPLVVTGLPLTDKSVDETPTLVTVPLPVPGVKPNAVVTSVDDNVTAPVRVLKLVTPPGVPFAALVTRPLASTVILARVYDPGDTAVEANVVAKLPVPEPVTSPVSVMV